MVRRKAQRYESVKGRTRVKKEVNWKKDQGQGGANEIKGEEKKV